MAHQDAALVGGLLKDRRVVTRSQTDVLDPHEVDSLDSAPESEHQVRVDVLVGEEADSHLSSRASSLARSPSGSGNSASTWAWISSASRSC